MMNTFIKFLFYQENKFYITEYNTYQKVSMSYITTSVFFIYNECPAFWAYLTELRPGL